MKIDKKKIENMIRKSLREAIEDNDKDPLYVEYLREIPHEAPFVLQGQKYQYVWAKYPNGKKDIGVYAFSGDVVYGYNAFRKMHNIKDEQTGSGAAGAFMTPKAFKKNEMRGRPMPASDLHEPRDRSEPAQHIQNRIKWTESLLAWAQKRLEREPTSPQWRGNEDALRKVIDLLKAELKQLKAV